MTDLVDFFPHKNRRTYLQVKVELSEKKHKGVELLLSIHISPGSCIPLLIFYLTSTNDIIVRLRTLIAAIIVLYTNVRVGKVTFEGEVDGSCHAVG